MNEAHKYAELMAGCPESYCFRLVENLSAAIATGAHFCLEIHQGIQRDGKIL